jgi:hypothetical protein
MLIRLIRPALAAVVLTALISPRPAFAAAELITIRIAHNGFASEMPFYVGKALSDDGRPTVKGTQLVIDAAVLDDPRAKNYPPQQLMDLSFLP